MSIFLIVHTWILYIPILYLWKYLRRTKTTVKDNPSFKDFTITVIIAAHNEERNIEGRIRNILDLNYDPGRIEIIVASDGSTDGTDEIVRRLSEKIPNLHLLAFAKQHGRAYVHNVAASMAEGELLLFTDAETAFHRRFLRYLLPHFLDPKVGAVSGRIYYLNESSSSIAESANLYWRLEERIRSLESDLGILAFGSGAAFCIRKGLYEPIKPTEDIDYALTMRVAAAGYLIRYEPRAIANDLISSSIEGAHKVRVRQTSRAFRGILGNLWSPFFWRRPRLAISILSHKVLRHLTPVLLLMVFANNLYLLESSPIYKVTFIIQLIFYSLALIGLIFHLLSVKCGYLSIPFNFCLINYSRLIGIIHSIFSTPPSFYR